MMFCLLQTLAHEQIIHRERFRKRQQHLSPRTTSPSINGQFVTCSSTSKSRTKYISTCALHRTLPFPLIPLKTSEAELLEPPGDLKDVHGHIFQLHLRAAN